MFRCLHSIPIAQTSTERVEQAIREAVELAEEREAGG